jgi:hypothetical protein
MTGLPMKKNGCACGEAKNVINEYGIIKKNVDGILRGTPE